MTNIPKIMFEFTMLVYDIPGQPSSSVLSLQSLTPLQSKSEDMHWPLLHCVWLISQYGRDSGKKKRNNKLNK